MDLHVRCFVCSIKTDEWRSGLHGLVSQHSNTLITVLIRTILGTFQSNRDIDDELNCICPDCLSRIEDCDWQRIAAQRCERELYELLVRTEKRAVLDTAALGGGRRLEGAQASGSAETARPIKCEQPPGAEPPSNMADSKPTTSEQSAKAAAEANDEHELLERFHDEFEGDDLDDELDDFDYDVDGDEDIDDEAIDEMENDPNLPYYIERRTSDDDYFDEEDDDLDDEDWDGTETEGKSKRARPGIGPAGPKVKRGRPRVHPVGGKEKRKPGRPRSRPEKIARPLGRPRIHPELERRSSGRPSERKPYECQMCDQVFEKHMQFQEHKRWHREQATPKFRCPKCHYISPDQEQCDAHVNLHETAEPLECVICQAKYSDIRTLKKHVRTHMQLRDFVCHLCGKQFFRSMSLSIHMKYHMNIRSKQCPHCPMTFVESKNLNRHMKTHTQEKPYACSICGRRFAHSYNVRPHERTHTERDVYRKFKCSFCNSAFDSKAKLATHMQKSHATVTPHLENTNKLAVEHTRWTADAVGSAGPI